MLFKKIIVKFDSLIPKKTKIHIKQDILGLAEDIRFV